MNHEKVPGADQPVSGIFNLFSIEPIMDALKFFQQSHSTLTPLFERFCVAILRRQSNGLYDEPMSGTLIEIGHRLFIATAGHVIKNNPNGGELWILTKKKRFPNQEGVLEFLRFNKSTWPDIGYLELNPSKATGYLTQEPCSIDRINFLGPGRPQRHVAMVGCLKEKTRIEKKGMSHGIIPIVKPYITVALMPDQWPDVPGTDPPSDPGMDVFLEYPREGIIEMDSGNSITLESAEGYSGGGLWDYGFDPEKTWSSDDISLFGIQSRWNETKRYVRGIQIIHWLRLIYQDYPDLRQELNRHFTMLG